MHPQFSELGTWPCTLVVWMPCAVMVSVLIVFLPVHSNSPNLMWPKSSLGSSGSAAWLERSLFLLNALRCTLFTAIIKKGLCLNSAKGVGLVFFKLPEWWGLFLYSAQTKVWSTFILHMSSLSGLTHVCAVWIPQIPADYNEKKRERVSAEVKVCRSLSR